MAYRDLAVARPSVPAVATVSTVISVTHCSSGHDGRGGRHYHVGHMVVMVHFGGSSLSYCFDSFDVRDKTGSQK